MVVGGLGLRDARWGISRFRDLGVFVFGQTGGREEVGKMDMNRLGR